MAQCIYDPFHSETNKARLLKAVKDAEQGKNMIAKTLEELEAIENTEEREDIHDAEEVLSRNEPTYTLTEIKRELGS